MKTTARFITTLALALAATGAMAAANTWKGDSGNWNDVTNWENDFSSNNNIAEDNNVYLKDAAAGKTIAFTDAFKWNSYGVYYQIQLMNGLEHPVVFTADTDAHGFTSDSGTSYEHLSVGVRGSDGSLKIEKGTYLFNDNVIVSASDNGTGNGTLEMTGGSLTAGNVYIGDANGKTGTLTMNGGTLTATSSFAVGQGGSANGTLNVAGGTLNVAGGDLTMSPNGATTATLNVTDGTLNVVNSVKIGGKKYSSASEFSGTIIGTVSGGTVTVGNEIAVGHAEYNTASLKISGGITSCKTLVLGNTTGATGIAEITGGIVTNVTGSGIVLAKNGSTTGTLSVNGGRVEMSTVANGYINIADGSGSTGRLYVGNDGEIAAQLIFIGTTGTGYMTVTGGTVKVTSTTSNRGGLNVGGNYDGNATGTAYYEQTAGTVTASLFTIAKDSSSTGTATLSGGVLEVPAITVGSGTGTLNLNGGTLRATAASETFIPSGLATTIGGTVTIDTDYDITIVPTLTGSGTIVKTGTGKLTFTETPPCNVKVVEGNVAFTSSTIGGKLTVASGAFYHYDSTVAYSGGIEVEEGGYLTFAATESGTVNVAVTGSGSLVVATGNLEKTGSATTDGNTVTITVSDIAATETTWIGATGADWNTAANWTHGVPTASTTASFIADAVAVASADCAAGKIVLNGHSLAFGAASGTTRRLLAIGEFDTTTGGTLVLKTAKITGAGGTGDSDLKPLVIPANVAIRVEAESELNDNWGTVSVLGKVTLNANLQLYYYVDLFGGVEGTGNINSCYVAARSRTTDVVIGTRLTGSRYFGGDWSNWSGSFTRTENTDERIVFINDLEATNAVFNLYGDVTLGTNSTATGTLTYKFGTLNMTGNARRIEYSSATASYVVQVAAGKFDSKKYFNNGNAATKVVNGTLRKVGTGSFTYTGFGFNTIEVQEGEFMFVDGPYIGDGSKFGERYTTIDTLTVAAGATLSGTNYTAMAIASLTLADGAFIAGPGTMLTSVTNATVTGAKVLVADTDALTTGTSYALITTTGGIAGAPYWAAVDAEGADVAASNGKAKWYWFAKVGNGGKYLVLREGNPNAGFAIIIR